MNTPRSGAVRAIQRQTSLTGGAETTRREASAVADKILAALSRPYRFEGAETGCEGIGHQCSSSTGLTLFAGNESDQGAIIKRADSAMYAAKRAGRNRACFDGSDATGHRQP